MCLLRSGAITIHNILLLKKIVGELTLVTAKLLILGILGLSLSQGLDNICLWK